jgi:hypothetical protein
MTFARWCALVAVVGSTCLAGGCGSGDTPRSVRTRSASATKRGPVVPATPTIPTPIPVPHAIPTPGPTGRPADPAAVNVIRGWSSALRHGDVRDAARYFAIPSLLANGGGAGGLAVIAIRNLAEADAANSTLPCGATFLSADQRGRYVNALFRLTDRPGPGGGCSAGTGQTARTNFIIKGGRIVEWIRAPDDPGDNARPPASPQPRRPPFAPAPSTSRAPSPVI